MKQEEIKESKKWVKDSDEQYEDDADVVKLDVGEAIQGLLISKKHSNLFGYVYKFQVKGDDRFKILCGTTVLNTKMANKQEGDEMMIERLKDAKNQAGRYYQVYETYHTE